MKKAKKLIIAIISCVLAAVLLVGCTPAGSFVPEETTKPIIGPTIPNAGDGITIESFVVRSPNYYFDDGEYYYFFATFLQQFVSSLTDEQLEKINLKINTEAGESLRDKSHPDGGTWFEYFRDITLEYMTDILLVCESAIASDPYITNDAQLYFDQQIKKPMAEQAKLDDSIGTFENLILLLYGGAVSATEYSNAIQKQYIYNVYYGEKFEELEKLITDADAELFAASEDFSGEKDEALSRNIAYIEVELGDAAQNKELANSLIEKYNAGEKTADALKKIAEDEKLVFGKLENITKDSGSVAAKWLFDESRKLGDGGIISLGDSSPLYVALVYYADGKPTYLLDAREQLADKRFAELVDSIASGTKIDVDNEKLNAIKA